MTRSYRFVIVDVFTDRAFGGNQLAVVLDADELSTAEMQAITREFNFSESTFVLTSQLDEAVRRVRIFTPAEEMPFAGHPTVGTTFVLQREGILSLTGASTEAVLEENIGPVTVRLEQVDGAVDTIWMRHRLPQWGPSLDDYPVIARMLGLAPADIRTDLPAQIVSTGVPFLFVPVRDLGAMRRIRFDRDAVPDVFASHAPVGIFAWTAEAGTAQGTVHSRMFAPHVLDILEDPATGAASGPLGAYLVRYGVVPLAPEVRIVSEQGFEMGRPSLITVVVRGGPDAIEEIWIGGQTVLVAEGTLYVPDGSQ